MADPTPDELARAAEYLSKSEDELFELLSGGDRDKAFPEDLIKRGRTIFINVKSNQQRKICGSERVRALFAEGPGNRRLVLVCAIADLLGGHGAMVVAALVVREGLETFCAHEWAQRAP